MASFHHRDRAMGNREKIRYSHRYFYLTKYLFTYSEVKLFRAGSYALGVGPRKASRTRSATVCQSPGEG